MKRGELSMEVIIIAAIALLVLVILSVLIIRGGTGVSGGTSCAGVGGECKDSCDPAIEGRSFHSCTSSGQVCCTPIDEQQS